MDDTIPLSFPAILRNPGLVDRYAHLRLAEDRSPVVVKRNKREERDGRRWIKRKENARFTGNPHIVLATKTDYGIPLPHIRATFPEPLPPYLPRNSKLPSVTPPIRDPSSANAGRFSLSIKGMRRELRKSGIRVQYLVLGIEDEMVSWLREGGTLLAPDAPDNNFLQLPGIPLTNAESIREVSRTPLQLIWSIPSDPFARYVVHCCARYHQIVSFSKEVSGTRLTYLLRPNVTRPDFNAAASLDSPPVTDLDYSSQIDTESDFVSDREIPSDASESDAEAPGVLSAISEMSSPGSYSPSQSMHSEAWTVVGDTDAEGDESGGEVDVTGQMASLSTQEDANQRSHTRPRIVMRTRMWDSGQGRSASSPSRSPARKLPRRVVRVDPPRSHRAAPPSFYDYLYA